MAFALSAANKGAMRKHDVDEDAMHVSLHAVLAGTVLICCIKVLFQGPTRLALFLSPQDGADGHNGPFNKAIKKKPKTPLRISPSIKKRPEVCTFDFFTFSDEVELHVLLGRDTAYVITMLSLRTCQAHLVCSYVMILS